MNNEIFNAFDSPAEKGGAEWVSFNAVTHDKTSLLNASMTPRRRTSRAPSSARFGASRYFILKRA
jgi:hypothetical protein